MKSLSLSIGSLLLVLNSAVAQNSTSPTSTIMIKPGCPSAAPVDVIVTRTAVTVPSCEAGNATKPMIVTMSTEMSIGGSLTGTGNSAQYTGAASNNRKGKTMAICGIAIAGLIF